MLKFEKNVQEMALMAAYVAGLVQAGVVFRFVQHETCIEVALTGGF